MKIERRCELSVEEFLSSYLARNTPVIVTDAISRWRSEGVWTLASFAAQFGDCDVPIYDDLFSVQTICRLKIYLETCCRAQQADSRPVPYVRWYSRLRAVDFAWADAAFARLSPHWEMPYFLPRSDYLFPKCSPPACVTPVHDPFPAKGIFISAAGAQTRRHIDPWGSDAALCQMLGRKQVLLFDPRTTAEHPAYDDVLESGEILFVPSGWPHHVISLSHSISLTWNFVHAAHAASFRDYLSGGVAGLDADILEYFRLR